MRPWGAKATQLRYARSAYGYAGLAAASYGEKVLEFAHPALAPPERLESESIARHPPPAGRLGHMRNGLNGLIPCGSRVARRGGLRGRVRWVLGIPAFLVERAVEVT